MSFPSLPLFVDDYEAATTHLSLEEDGAYSRLLRLNWRQSDCSIPADDEWIARRMRVDSETYHRVVKPVLAEFFTRSRGRWFQKRLREEHAYVLARSDARSAAGRKGGNAKAAKTKGMKPSNATFLPEQNGSNALAPTLTPNPIEEREDKSSLAPKTARASRFDEFWNAYPHRDGVKRARAKVEAKYRAAVKSGVPEQSLVDAATRFRSDKRVRDGFACDPLTWFGRRGWEDEPAANPIVAGKPLPNFEQAIDNLERGIRAGRWPRADLLTAAHVEALITRRVLTREEAARRGFPLAAAPIRKETA
jgi:uncharacterized protein YdaU (DUF1376 family)